MPPEKPFFSIVCTTHNRAKLLLRAVNSVLRQEFKDFELIIVNDGSTDETCNVLNTFKDRRIICLEHPNALGLNAARNTGIMKARGKLIAFLDDDDELSDSALEIAVETYRNLHNDRVKMLIFNIVDFETSLVSGENLGKRMIITFQDLLCRKLTVDHWIVVDRDILPKNSVFDERAVGGALPLWIRLLRSYDAYYVPVILYYAYRIHGMDRMDHAKFKFEKSKECEYYFSELLKEFGAEMKCSCPKVFSKYSAELAFWQMINKNFRLAQITLFLSIRANFSYDCLALFLLSFFGNKNIVKNAFRLRVVLINFFGKF